MASEKTQDFLNRFEEDTDFRESVKKAPDFAAKFSLVKQAGFELTPVELNQALTAEHGGQLSDADLEAVAGGAGGGDIHWNPGGF